MACRRMRDPIYFANLPPGFFPGSFQPSVLFSTLSSRATCRRARLCLRMRPAGRRLNEAPHFGEQLLPFCRLHQLMIRCSAHHCDIFVRGKFLDPDTAGHARFLKVSALLDLFARVANLFRRVGEATLPGLRQSLHSIVESP